MLTLGGRMQAHLKPHLIIAGIGFIVFVYSLYLLQRDISGVYQGAQSFFDQGSYLYPTLVTALVGIAPVCVFSLASLAFFNKTGLYTIPVAAYGWFILGGYIITAFIVLFLGWQLWARRDAST